MTRGKMIELLEVRYYDLIQELDVDSTEVEFYSDVQNDIYYGWKFYIPSEDMTYVLFIDKLTANIMLREYDGDYFGAIEVKRVN